MNNCVYPKSNVRTPTADNSNMQPSNKIEYYSAPSSAVDSTFTLSQNKRKLTYSEPASIHKKLCLSPTPTSTPVSSGSSRTILSDCSLTYLDTMPTNINKLCDSYNSTSSNNEAIESSDSETETSSSDSPVKIENFYANWRKNFEEWLLVKNPKKYNEFKNYIKFNNGNLNSIDSQHNRSLSDSVVSKDNKSIRNKINQYLVTKPNFNSKISKKFKNKGSESILNNIIRKTSITNHISSKHSLREVAHKASNTSSLISPMLADRKQTTSTSKKSVKLPSITEILIPGIGFSDKRSISESSVDSSSSSVFSECSKQYDTSSDSIATDDSSSFSNAHTYAHITVGSSVLPSSSNNLSVFKTYQNSTLAQPFSPKLHSNFANSNNRGENFLPSAISTSSGILPEPLGQNKVSSFEESKSKVNIPSLSKKPKSPRKQKASNHSKRTCLSCGSNQSPCWRPSWNLSEGQLCNSCGLRYKKTGARCVSETCLRIPAKGEFNLIKSKANNKVCDYKCLKCGSGIEVK